MKISFLSMKYFSFFLSAGILISSCSGEKTSEEKETVQQEEMIEEQEASTSFILPSPLQIANIFKKSGLNYLPGITNPVENTSKYTTNFSKALALGTYSSDIAYNIVNKKPQEALNYLKVIKQLASDLGMSNVFESESLLLRFEKNIGNEDSLAYIIADLQIGFDSFLEDNEKEYLSVIIFTGAWIESMYVGSKSSEGMKNEKLYSKLGEQFNILNNLIKALEIHKESSPSIPALATELGEIKKVFIEFGFSIEDDAKEIALTEENVAKLSTSIEAVRTKFVSGNFQ